ncbi:NUDIX hydrolase [Halalkalibacillus halophilus]|uniref:NUDIX hydrolase n=1 Tax=Halalkalibacillus halophilus TaxID=392827 RepID=UPI0004215680|nr:NUDIX hydrolase [Halalkalibacillus halophilus]
MIHKRNTFQIKPEYISEFNYLFHKYIYPEFIKKGAKLIGRWTNEAQDEVVEIWEFNSKAHYESVNFEIDQNKEECEKLNSYVTESKEDFLTTTVPQGGSYHPPKHIMSVSGYITNEKGEVLLVRNFHRSNTLEIPGGQVEEGETLEQAIHREILEETGVEVKLIGITGIYQNMSRGVTCVVFRGEYYSGTIRTAEDETSEVFFAQLTEENLNDYITREHFRNRTLDAMHANYLPYEAFYLRPYELITRYESHVKND